MTFGSNMMARQRDALLLAVAAKVLQELARLFNGGSAHRHCESCAPVDASMHSIGIVTAAPSQHC
jgi:hypothetical protein